MVDEGESEGLEEGRARALREEELLPLLLNAVRQAIIATDLKGIILYWNRFAEGLYGWSAEDVLGKDISQILMPHDTARARAAVAGMPAVPTPGREWTVRRKDGAPVSVSAAATPMFDAAGKHLGIVGVSWDVSEKKKLEEDLHRSESRLKAFVEQLPALAWATNAQLELVWSLGGSFRPLEGWAGAAGAAGAHARALAGDAAAYEIEDAGVVRHAVVQPFRDPFGEIAGTIGVAFDITKRKRAEDALRESERRLADAQKIGRVGSWEMDVATHTLVISDELFRILGHVPNDVVPTQEWYFTCVHPEDRTALRMRAERFLDNAGVTTEEYRIVRPDGTERVVSSHGQVVHDAAGRPVRMIGALRDITEQKAAEREIAQRAERQAAIAELGLEALRYTELPALLEEAVRVMRRTLGTNFTGIFEVLGDDSLRLGAFDGFPNASDVRALRIPRDDRSQATFTRNAKSPVVSEDFATETRFDLHPALRVLGVTSSITAPIHGHDRVYGIVAAHSVAPRSFGEGDRTFLQAVANTLGFAMERRRVEEELRVKREQLRALSRRLIETQEAERRSLARELHDDFGQFLTVVRLHLQAARNARPVEATRSLGDALHLVDQGIDQVRSLALDLRPSILDDLGLMAALRWLVKRQAQRGGFHVDVTGDVGGGRLRADVETCAFRVVQEALTNVARHASASNVAIIVDAGGNELRILVRDVGKGFDVAAARERSASGASLGLVSMEERATLVGGRLEIDSRIGAGTTIRAHVPLGGTA